MSRSHKTNKYRAENYRLGGRKIGAGFEKLETRCTPAVLPAGFSDNLVDDGLTRPVAMTQTPDGRFLVAQQDGALRVVKNGSLLTNPFVSLSVSSTGERGLLGVAVDPNFVSNQFVYVYYTTSTAPIHNRVSRFTANGDVAQAGSETVLLDLDNLSAGNHNGGAIHFGNDGKLYIATGDNAVSANSQSLNTVLGKMLRINPNPSNLIPSDNPFLGQTTGINQSIWALGLRNPFTFAVNPKTGRIHINDVGQTTWEEINQGVAGANYGWPETEGYTTNPAYTTPVFAYQHGTGQPQGNVITGGTFYDPPNASFPTAHRGDYYFTDLVGGWIWRYDLATDSAVQFADFSSEGYQPVELLTGRDGNLYFLSRSTGALRQISYTSQAPVLSSFGGNVTYTANSPGVRLTTTFAVADSDSPNFQAGQLRILIASGSQTSDRLFFRNAGDLTVTSTQVLYRGVVFGTFSGGTGSNALVVTFNAAATPTKVALLMRNTLFRNTTTTPSTTTRVLQVRLTDGDGATSNTVSKSILIASPAPSLVARNYVIASTQASGIVKINSEVKKEPLHESMSSAESVAVDFVFSDQDYLSSDE
jgi:glucose/arabinose dehydrogenase